MIKKINARLASLRLKAMWYIAEVRALAYFKDFPNDPDGVEVTQDEWMDMIKEIRPEAEAFLQEKLNKLLKGGYEEVTEEDAISEYERDHAEREKKLQEERDRLLEETKGKQAGTSKLPFSMTVERSGTTSIDGRMHPTFYLPGHPRDDYGSEMDIFFGDLKFHVKETRDMEIGPDLSKYRPLGGIRAVDTPGIEIYAPENYSGNTITVYHN